MASVGPRDESVGANSSRLYLHVAVVAACSTRHGAIASNRLTSLHMTAAANWGVGDVVAAAATRAFTVVTASRAVTAGVRFGLSLHLD